MIYNQLQALLPIIVLAGSVVLILLLVSFFRNYKLTASLTGMAFVLSFLSLWLIPRSAEYLPAFNLLKMDGYAVFITGLIIAAAFAVLVLSYNYFCERKSSPELYILLIIATIGACVLASSSHFISLFLGLEIMSVSLYILIAFNRDSVRNIEAGVKYLILASASSAFLLFGMALLYAETGAMDFATISSHFAASANASILTYFAVSLMIVGFGFKLALAPFHMWTPDVYQGASAPVTAFIATVSKGAAAIVLLRLFVIMNAHQHNNIMLIFTVLSVLSMFTGNLLALRQRNIKRLLAYSSIAHIGYLLIAMIAGGSNSGGAVLFYLTAYFITTLTAFGVISIFSGSEGEIEQVEAYKGLAWKRPFIGAVFTASLLSLAGIPLTAGFIGKYYIVFAGVSSGVWMLAVLLIVNSVISLYYYLRVIAAIYEKPDASPSGTSLPVVSITGGALLAVLTLFLIWAGVYPQTLIDIIKSV